MSSAPPAPGNGLVCFTNCLLPQEDGSLLEKDLWIDERRGVILDAQVSASCSFEGQSAIVAASFNSFCLHSRDYGHDQGTSVLSSGHAPLSSVYQPLAKARAGQSSTVLYISSSDEHSQCIHFRCVELVDDVMKAVMLSAT